MGARIQNSGNLSNGIGDGQSSRLDSRSKEGLINVEHVVFVVDDEDVVSHGGAARGPD
jgi:hypothetical protein